MKELIQSGDTRNKTICNALEKIKELHGKDEIIVVHHANMPFVREEEIEKIIGQTNSYDVIFAVVKQYNYMVRFGKNEMKFIDREGVFQIATPEAMNMGNAIEIYERLKEEESISTPYIFALDSDLAQRLTYGVVECSSRNFKITTFEDFEMARALILTDQV